MENQANLNSQVTQDTDPTPVTQQPVLSTKINFFPIVLTAIVCAVLFGFGGYYLGNKSLNSPQNSIPNSEVSNSTPTILGSPSPEPLNQLEGWKVFESNPKGITLKYPLALIACGNKQGEITPRSYISVHTTEPCDSSGASENIFWVADESLSIKSNENQLFNYLKDLKVGQTVQGMTEGEKMADVTYTRMPDTKVGEFTAQNYRSDSSFNKKSDRSLFYSYIFGLNGKVYFIGQSYLNSYPNQYQVDFPKTFENILFTVKFTD